MFLIGLLALAEFGQWRSRLWHWPFNFHGSMHFYKIWPFVVKGVV